MHVKSVRYESECKCPDPPSVVRQSEIRFFAWNSIRLLQLGYGSGPHHSRGIISCPFQNRQPEYGPLFFSRRIETGRHLSIIQGPIPTFPGNPQRLMSDSPNNHSHFTGSKGQKRLLLAINGEISVLVALRTHSNKKYGAGDWGYQERKQWGIERAESNKNTGGINLAHTRKNNPSNSSTTVSSSSGIAQIYHGTNTTSDMIIKIQFPRNLSHMYRGKLRLFYAVASTTAGWDVVTGAGMFDL